MDHCLFFSMFFLSLPAAKLRVSSSHRFVFEAAQVKHLMGTKDAADVANWAHKARKWTGEVGWEVVLFWAIAKF